MPNREYREAETRRTALLTARMRIGLWVFLGASPLFLTAHALLLRPNMYFLTLVGVVQSGASLMCLLLLRRPLSISQVETVSLVAISVSYCAMSAAGLLTGDTTTILILSSILAFGTATLLPWRVGAQMRTAAIAAAAVLATAFFAHDGTAPVIEEPIVGVFLGLAASVYIAHALSRERAAASRVEEALHFLAEGVSSVTGKEFFRSLACYLAESLEAEYAFVGQLTEPDADGIRTLAVCAHGQVVDNFEYDLRDTPCANVIGRDVCWYPRGVQQQFPRDTLLADMGVDSYIGMPLLDSLGKPLGLLVVMDRRPFSRLTLSSASTILRIFAVRASAELERMRGEEQLKEEAAVAAGLARVGHELIASLDTPALLNRLCQLTAEVLQADASHTFLFEENADGAAVAVEGYGDTPEQWEVMRALRISRSSLAPLLERLQDSNIAQVSYDPGKDIRTSTFATKHGITSSLQFPLRRGRDIVGIQSADYRGSHPELSEVRKRLGGGISQLASLALETARLLEELEEANRLKADFLANMSHELRTPLNVIIGYNEMLAEGAFGPLNDEQVSTIERVKRNAQEQLALVTTTLELSRFEARDTPIDVAEIDLAEFIDELAREAATLPRRSELDLKWYCEPGIAPLNSDRVKLRMVLKNLIDNAIKFTERGSVSVQARSLDGGIEFRVIDTGIGIAAEEQRRIFEPFQQSGDSKAQNRGGVGLGLHLVNRLVEALDGTSRVESKLGRGSTFFVWVPNNNTDVAATSLRESA